MPPRIVVAVVVAGWLATMGWLAAEKWLPWLRAGEEPAFVVELADEVAPQQASWTLFRKGKKIGNAETRMAPRPGGTFELSTRLRDLELSAGSVDVRMPLVLATRTVNRDGELLALNAKATMLVRVFGAEVRIETTVQGTVHGDEFQGTCELDTGSGKETHKLEPVRLMSKRAFSPFEPLQKHPALKPGQTWRVSSVDPVGQALDAALRLAAAQLLAEAFPGKAPFSLPTRRPPKELLAQVLADTEEVSHRGKVYTCRVIVYRSDEMTARTWVDVEDGKVVRQEAVGLGDAVVLQRD
jgi:hypothetical protein